MSNEILDQDYGKFRVEERVYCLEGEDLYAATIKKTAFKDGGWSYLVHYLGWNSRWDKWLPESSVLRDTEERRKMVEQKEQKNKKKRKRSDNDSKGKKDGWQEYCELPFTLKTVLIDERERIMRMSFVSNYGVDLPVPGQPWKPARDVHVLPASVPIKTVLNQYVKYKKREPSTEEAGLAAEKKARAFVDSLSKLFEEALPVCLLYHPERAQYLAIKEDPQLKALRKTEIYGCEFLLRLFCRLPTLLENCGEINKKELGPQIMDLIILLQKNRQSCFKSKFRGPKELNDYEKAVVNTIPMDDGA